MATELERYKEALAYAMARLDENVCLSGYNIAHKEVNAILNPVEYEDVPVVRWECPKCGTVYADKEGSLDYDTRSQPLEWGKCSCFRLLRPDNAIKLTGTVRREKRVPKELTGKLTLYDDGSYCLITADDSTSRVKADIEGSFTWPEDP